MFGSNPPVVDTWYTRLKGTLVHPVQSAEAGTSNIEAAIIKPFIPLLVIVVIGLVLVLLIVNKVEKWT